VGCDREVINRGFGDVTGFGISGFSLRFFRSESRSMKLLAVNRSLSCTDDNSASSDREVLRAQSPSRCQRSTLGEYGSTILKILSSNLRSWACLTELCGLEDSADPSAITFLARVSAAARWEAIIVLSKVLARPRQSQRRQYYSQGLQNRFHLSP